VPALLSALAEDSLGGVAYGRMLAVLVHIAPEGALAPALAGLDDARSHVQWAARDTLGAIPGIEATQTLVRLLDDPSPDVVMHAAGLLATRRDAAAVVPLASLFSQANQVIRCSAAQALAEIDDPEARRALSRHLPTESDPEVRKIVQAALGDQERG
jgi:HEAT repeat protein